MSLSDFVEPGVSSPPVFGVDAEEAIMRLRKELGEALPFEMGDVVARMQQLRSMLESVELEAVNAFGYSHEWSVDGFRHPTSWIKDRCRVPHGHAGRRVRLGRKLESMPHTAEAFAAGLIDVAHVDRLARANRPQWADAFAEFESMLVQAAIDLDYKRFNTAVAYFEQCADPDPDGTSERRDATRRAHCSPLMDGMGKVDALMDPVGYATFSQALRQIEQELFEADWAEGLAEHGDEMCIDKMRRTSVQRRCDAMTEMATRATSVPKAAKRPEPSVIVHIDSETFEAELKRRVGVPFEFPPVRMCELQDGTPITPGEAMALALEGFVRRMVFDTDGVVTSFGRRKRFFTGGLRELIEARDRHCTGPGCDVPHYQCDVDHAIEWHHLGGTDADNGDLLCPWHHRFKSRYEILKDPVTRRARWRLRREAAQR